MTNRKMWFYNILYSLSASCGTSNSSKASPGSNIWPEITWKKDSPPHCWTVHKLSLLSDKTVMKKAKHYSSSVFRCVSVAHVLIRIKPNPYLFLHCAFLNSLKKIHKTKQMDKKNMYLTRRRTPLLKSLEWT